MIKPAIPFIDIRNSSPVELVRRHPEKAHALLGASRNAFGPASRLASPLLLPLGDRKSRAWLERTANPYAAEIAEYGRLLQAPGITALNLAYEWGCTSGVYEGDDGMTLTRILDWPFKALGESVVVAHQAGTTGDFHNATWPAVSGVFNAVAAGRFAAALNQAPMRRYRTDIATDWVRNRLRLDKTSGLPPAHLLRKAFETAPDYASAKAMLTEEKLALPVIYILSGTRPGEGCIIERLEEDAVVRELGDGKSVCAANHFESRFNGIGHGWMPRASDSYGRARHAAGLTGAEIDAQFSWFSGPIANELSRIAMTANAATGRMQLIGTAGTEPVTAVYDSARTG